MSEKCYLCGSTDGKCSHFPTTPASHDAGEADGKMWSFLHDSLHEAHKNLNATGGGEVYYAVLDSIAAKLETDIHSRFIATLTAEVARLTGELAETRNALDDAADEVANWGAYAAEYFQQKHDLVGAVEKLRVLAKGKSSITTADQLRAELEKETAHSKHLAGAVSRKIDELIAVENQCSYYRMQYSRAEQVRKEACEANVKAQAAMSWMEADLERSRKECERLREALASLIGATRHLNPCPGTMEQALAALSASGREGE